MNNWINVNDRLPEFFEYVLLHSRMGIELGFYNGSDFYALYQGPCVALIEYWQPLPDPPQN